MEINGVEAPRYTVYSFSLVSYTCTSFYLPFPFLPPFPLSLSLFYPFISVLLFLPLSIDRTLKMYIGGAQKRPDAPYARPVMNPSGKIVGQVSEGNRKDIREAVEAAHRAAPGCVTDWL